MKLTPQLLARIVLAFSLVCGCVAAASAQEDANARIATVNSGTVGVISGGVDGTYVRIAADLASVLDDGDQLRVLSVLGKGSVQNVTDILYLRGIDVGIVQSDVLAYAQQQRLFPGVENTVQYITKLYEEEVHILARPGINRIQDLAGKAVNVDNKGSGTAMTAYLLFGKLGVSPTFTFDDQSNALERLKRGEIDALVYVVGKPARLFSQIDGRDGLHFLPIPLSPELAETYLPTRLDHTQYPALVADNAPVETVAVGAVMAVFAWQPGSERYRKVSRFVEAFFSKFSQFQEPPRHPKWREVNLAAQVPGWKRFPAATEWLQRTSTVASRNR